MPDPRIDRKNYLQAVVKLVNIYHLKQLAMGVVKANNCIIMPVLDYKNEIPKEGTGYVPKPDWEAHLKGTLEASPREVDNTKFSCLYVPVRVKNEWFLLICDMGNRKCDWVMFNEW